LIELIKKYTGKYRLAALSAPLMVSLEVLFDVLIPYLMTFIIDNGINAAGGADISLINRYGLYMVLLSVLGMCAGGGSGALAAIASSGFVKNLRSAVFAKIQTFSFHNMDKFEVPSLVTRTTSDLRQIRMAYMMVIRQMVRCPLQLIISTVIVMRMDRELARVFLVAIPVLGIILYSISHFAHPRFRILMRKFDAMNASLEENFMAIRVVKTFVREDYEKEKFLNTSIGVRDTQRWAESLVILNQPLFNIVMYSCMIAISWFGGKRMIAGVMTTGTFMGFLSYIRQILFSLLGLSGAIMQVVFAQASIDRINEVLHEKVDLTDDEADANAVVDEGSIEFKNVSFRYSKDAEEESLSDINLKIEPGQMVGIIGSTGTGKTSLVNLIPRLYDATEGEVLVGGRNVKDYKLDHLRTAVAMVLQKNMLFSGTIEENLKWGNPQAAHEEVVAAAKCAQADSFISSFPDGYDTYLGQGGVNVSGGQKQRLCIARALLKKPKIMIMDDSTSAVDTDTDRRIRTALKEELSGMTVLIIAQRISSIQEADQILVMDNGRITDRGTHEELMERNAIYRDLYETQQSGVSE